MYHIQVPNKRVVGEDPLAPEKLTERPHQGLFMVEEDEVNL